MTCSDFTFSKGLVAVRTADGGGGAGGRQRVGNKEMN